MNYFEINSAILEGRDVSPLLVKDNDFYKYLLNNKVAYYYSAFLSKTRNSFEEAIIKRGDEFNQKYLKTLRYIEEVARQNDIDVLLYKTHKYIPEAVDGDVDIFVKPSDFSKFLSVFETNGFTCVEDEPGKGKCEKEGYCIIEPHTAISWRNGKYFSGDVIWHNPVQIEGLGIRSVSIYIETIGMLSKVFFEPDYLDLYSLKQLEMYIETMSGDSIDDIAEFSEACKWLMARVNTIDRGRSMPYFPELGWFLYFWTKECIKSGQWNDYIRHIIFRVYWSIRYRVANRLPFTHDWGLNI